MNKNTKTIACNNTCRTVKDAILPMIRPEYMETNSDAIDAVCEKCDSKSNAQGLCNLSNYAMATTAITFKGKSKKQVQSQIKFAGHNLLKDINRKYDDTERRW